MHSHYEKQIVSLKTASIQSKVKKQNVAWPNLSLKANSSLNSFISNAHQNLN